MDKMDYKKVQKEYYLPKTKPEEIVLPEMGFIMVQGKGDPTGEEYQQAMQLLYALTFTIKMSKLSGNQPQGYFEYVVPPLEGVWWDADKPREAWQWVSMIRQPEFVTQEVFEAAVAACKKKKPELPFSRAFFRQWREGGCVQMMHVGPYAAEEASFCEMRALMRERNLRQRKNSVSWHHEIYLSNPQRVKSQEKLRTILRIPVEE